MAGGGGCNSGGGCFCAFFGVGDRVRRGVGAGERFVLLVGGDGIARGYQYERRLLV